MKSGDTVYLKSGSPPLTFSHTWEYNNVWYAKVTYFNCASGLICDRTVSVEVLTDGAKELSCYDH